MLTSAVTVSHQWPQVSVDPQRRLNPLDTQAKARKVEGEADMDANGRYMESMLAVWNEWEIRMLVLTSLALQVFLLFFAGIRKRNVSAALSLLLWLAYLLADSIATPSTRSGTSPRRACPRPSSAPTASRPCGRRSSSSTSAARTPSPPSPSRTTSSGSATCSACSPRYAKNLNCAPPAADSS